MTTDNTNDEADRLMDELVNENRKLKAENERLTTGIHYGPACAKSDYCLIANPTGVCCPADSCDLEDGVRSMPGGYDSNGHPILERTAAPMPSEFLALLNEGCGWAMWAGMLERRLREANEAIWNVRSSFDEDGIQRVFSIVEYALGETKPETKAPSVAPTLGETK